MKQTTNRTSCEWVLNREVVAHGLLPVLKSAPTGENMQRDFDISYSKKKEQPLPR